MEDADLEWAEHEGLGRWGDIRVSEREREDQMRVVVANLSPIVQRETGAICSHGPKRKRKGL